MAFPFPLQDKPALACSGYPPTCRLGFSDVLRQQGAIALTGQTGTLRLCAQCAKLFQENEQDGDCEEGRCGQEGCGEKTPEPAELAEPTVTGDAPAGKPRLPKKAAARRPPPGKPPSPAARQNPPP